MKLFFETAVQGTLFLVMLPIGMLLAACVDLCGSLSRFRVFWDVLTMLVFFVLLGICIVLLNDETLRLYHILAVLTGYLLYAFGIRRLFGGIDRWMSTRKKHTKQAGE